MDRWKGILQRNFGDGYDGNEDDHDDGYGPWKAFGEEDVGGNLVSHSFAKHEQACDSHGPIDQILQT